MYYSPRFNATSYFFFRYTYEICLFGEARQKSNSGSVQSLGHFSSWRIGEKVGTPNYYSRQMFTGGAKCWNGPHRSVQVCILHLGVGGVCSCTYRLSYPVDLKMSF